MVNFCTKESHVKINDGSMSTLDVHCVIKSVTLSIVLVFCLISDIELPKSSVNVASASEPLHISRQTNPADTNLSLNYESKSQHLSKVFHLRLPSKFKKDGFFSGVGLVNVTVFSIFLKPSRYRSKRLSAGNE